jgi:FlaA1/EpsC-like NDP-sugar epimerase
MLGQTGKVFVLDMGEPVRIVDLATDMARLSGLTPGYDIDIHYTGIRPGEKLNEELFTDQEHGWSNVHAKVFEATQEPRNRAIVERVLRSLREAVYLPDGIRQQTIAMGFMELVPAYQPSESGLGRYLPEPVAAGNGADKTVRSPDRIVEFSTPFPLTQLHPS